MATKKKPSKFTKAQILAFVKASAEANAKAGSKSNYTDKGAQNLADAISHALTIPTLASAGLGNSKSKTEAQARRDFCKSVGAKALAPNSVMRKNTSGRAEAGLDQRLQTVAVLMGLAPKAFYAVRTKPNKGAGDDPKVFIIMR